MSDFDTEISTSSIPSDMQKDLNIHLLNFVTNEELNRKTRLASENRFDFLVEELGKQMYVHEEAENEHIKGSESSCLSIKVKERKRLMVLPENENKFHVHQSSSVSNIASLLNEAKNCKKIIFLGTPVPEHKIINVHKISDSANCDTKGKNIESSNIASKEQPSIPQCSGKMKMQKKINSHENAVPSNTISTQGNPEFLNNNSSVSVRCKRPLSPVKSETKFGSKQSRKTISSKIADYAENAPKIMSARNMLYGTTDKMNDTHTNEKRFNNHLESNVAEKTKLGVQKKDDEDMINTMLSEILNTNPNVKFEDIAGLDFVKTTVREIVIWPFLRPDIFCGLRAPPKGVLLFGPPGTGKTLIGKCIATESNATFFCISASSLTSKYVGEGEKLVRTLFAVARSRAPSVIFIDEIDSLLSQRCGGEQDYSRKLKTEFLVQFDGAKTSNDDRILVVGATNRPQELDEAARRRFVKRLYVPLPDLTARHQIVTRLISKYTHQLSASDMDNICNETEGYSCADISNLCKEASMGPIRSNYARLETISLDELRAINVSDFKEALGRVKSSVSKADIDAHLEFNKTFGCGNSV